MNTAIYKHKQANKRSIQMTRMMTKLNRALLKLKEKYLSHGLTYDIIDSELIRIADENSYDSVMLAGVLKRNDLQLREVMNKITGALGPNLYKKRITLLGIAFKEGTNDVRQSLSLRLYRLLRDQGALVVGHDLLAASETAEIEPNLVVTSDMNVALHGANAVVVLNAESAYSSFDWSSVISSEVLPYVIDTRGVVDVTMLSNCGITFDVLGSAV